MTEFKPNSFDQEWKKQMMKFTKKELIQLLSKANRKIAEIKAIIRGD